MEKAFKQWTILAVLLIFVSFTVVFISFQESNDLSNKIISYIDANADENNTVVFNMNEFTNFKWDKMVIYDVGASNTQISEALGVEYKDSTDLMTGMVFVFPFQFENPSELIIHVGDNASYRVFTPNNAVFEIGKGQLDEKNYYYWIQPFNNN